MLTVSLNAGKARLAAKAAQLADDARTAAQASAPRGIRVVAAKPSLTQRAAETGSKLAGAVASIGDVVDAPVRAANTAIQTVADATGRGMQKAGTTFYRGALREGEPQRAIAEQMAHAVTVNPDMKGQKLYSKTPLAQPEEIGIRLKVAPSHRAIGKRQGQIKGERQMLADQDPRPLIALAEGITDRGASNAGRIRQIDMQLEELKKLHDVISDSSAPRLGTAESIAGATGLALDSLSTGGLLFALTKALRTPHGRLASGVALDRLGSGLQAGKSVLGDEALRSALLARLLEQGQRDDQ